MAHLRAKGFLYLVAIMDWHSRKVLAWRLSNTLDVQFCVDALDVALNRYGSPDTFNTDQGSQFTSWAWTHRLKEAGGLDNIFIERLWRSLKYDCVYLHACSGGSDARDRIGEWVESTITVALAGRMADERRVCPMNGEALTRFLTGLRCDYTDSIKLTAWRTECKLVAFKDREHMFGRIPIVIACILSFTIIGWYSYQSFVSIPFSPVDLTAKDEPKSVQIVNGETVVIVDPEAQRAINIGISPLAAAKVRDELSAYATVVDVQSLFDLRFRLAAAREYVEQTAATAKASRAQFKRSKSLLDKKVISQQRFQDMQAAIQTDQDKLDSAKVAMDGLAARAFPRFSESETVLLNPC